MMSGRWTRKSARATQPPDDPQVISQSESSDMSSPGDSSSSSESDNTSNESGGFAKALLECIGSRKQASTPIFDFISKGNETGVKGWLRKALLGANCSIRMQQDEKKLLFFLFMSLSGVPANSNAAEILSVAWGFSKISIRKACTVVAEGDFLGWILKSDGIDNNERQISSPAVIGTNVPRSFCGTPSVPETMPMLQATNLFTSPLIASPDPKRPNTKSTPNVLSFDEDEVVAPMMRGTGRSPSNSHDSEDSRSGRDEPINQATRLDFGQGDPNDLEEASVKPTLCDVGSQTELFHSRLQANILEKNISKECEEDLCKALHLLFDRQKRIKEAADLNDKNDTKDMIAASNEVLTLRQFSRGTTLKIMRIKSTRQTKGDDRKRKLRRKGFLVRALFRNLDLKQEEVPAILRIVCAKLPIKVLTEKECTLAISQVAALMQYLPATGRGLERLQKFFRAVLPGIGCHLFPTMLRKKLAVYSMESFNIRIGFELVSLAIGGATRNQKCLHVWISEPGVALENLTQSAIMAGKFEDSFDFCNHKDELIVVQGTDRGGDITACLIRVANRMGGNASQHCIPLAFYEFGKESYSNLEATIFHDKRPTKKFLQSLLHGDYHMLIVKIRGDDDENTNEDDDKGSDLYIDAQCLMLQFEWPQGMRKRRLSFNRRYPDETVLRLEQLDEKELPTSIVVFNENERNWLGGLSANKLWVQLVRRDMTIDGCEAVSVHIGFVLRNCLGRVIHQGPVKDPLQSPFKDPMRNSAEDHDHVLIDCLWMRCFTADDQKCNTCIMGQSTASAMCPCPICIALRKDFLSALTLPENKLPVRREGSFANPVLHEGFVREAGGRAEWARKNHGGLAKALKLKCRSVVHKPLCYAPPDLNTGSGMHVSSGLLTHCTIRILEALAKIDRELPWLDALTEQLSDAKEFISESKKLADKLRKKDTLLARDAEAAKGMTQPGDEGQLGVIQSERQQLSIELDAVTKARDAANLFVEKGDEFMAGQAKKTKIRIIGPATHSFRKAHEVDGRVSFRVENSGFELSNGDGMLVLERREAIAKRMARVFVDDHPELHQEVTKLMDVFLELGGMLYWLSTKMKSQRKMSRSDAEELSRVTKRHGLQWTQFLRDEAETIEDADTSEPNVFNKLHLLRPHMPQFAELHGMLGRVLEEGFESSHKCIENVRKPLVCMTSTQTRAETIYQRMMLQSRPEVEATLTLIERKFTRKKRGPHQINRIKNKSTDDATGSGIDRSGRQELPEGFVHSISGCVVKETWKECFEYVCFSKVPESWSKVFRIDPSLGGVCKEKVEFL